MGVKCRGHSGHRTRSSRHRARGSRPAAVRRRAGRSPCSVPALSLLSGQLLRQGGDAWAEVTHGGLCSAQATSRALGTGAGPASPQSRGRVGQPRGAAGSARGPRSRGRPLSARSCPHGGSRAPGGGDREAGGHARFPEPPRSFPDLRALPSGPGSQPRVPAWATAVPRLNPPAWGPGEAVPRENEGKHPTPP